MLAGRRWRARWVLKIPRVDYGKEVWRFGSAEFWGFSIRAIDQRDRLRAARTTWSSVSLALSAGIAAPYAQTHKATSWDEYTPSKRRWPGSGIPPGRRAAGEVFNFKSRQIRKPAGLGSLPSERETAPV